MIKNRVIPYLYSLRVSIYMYLCVGVVLFIIPCKTFSQFKIEGQVFDSETNEPLSFAGVSTVVGQEGTVCDLEGRFLLYIKNQHDTLRITYLGYKEKRIPVKEFIAGFGLGGIVRLEPTSVELATVEIIPGFNRALPIIQKAIDSRESHKPELYPKFEYESYNKLRISPEDSSISKSFDSLNTELFLWESATVRYYDKSKGSKETVVASRISGLKGYPVPFSPTDIQDLTFYADRVQVLGVAYLSPLALNALNKYTYTLVDSAFSESKDAIYTIAFTPQNPNPFLLEGVLRISSRGYAILSIDAHAKPPKDVGAISALQTVAVHIKQLHHCINDSVWFPAELDTDAQLAFENAEGKVTKLKFVIRSYIQNIKLSPVFSKNTFKGADVEVNENAGSQTEAFWESRRANPLTAKEINTYTTVDSILGDGIAVNLLRQLPRVLQGYVRIGAVDLDLLRIYRNNPIEGNRLGLGFVTNERVASFWRLGAWAGYGFNDSKWKYGSFLRLYPTKDESVRLELGWEKDLTVTGSNYVGINTNRPLFQRRNTYFNSRVLYMPHLDYSQKQYLALFFPSLQHFQHRFFVKKEKLTPGYNYQYENSRAQTLNFMELGAEVRFAPSEKLTRQDFWFVSEMGTLPVTELLYVRGLKDFGGGDFAWHRLSAAINQQFRIGIHALHYRVTAGGILGQVPYQRLYIFEGNGHPSIVGEANMFNTMGLVQFAADRYVTAHTNFKFTNAQFPSLKWSPDLSIVLGFGYGRLQDNTTNFVQAPTKGYYESGLVFNNILPKAVLRYLPSLAFMGLGVYTRMGPYANNALEKNIVFKLQSGFTF